MTNSTNHDSYKNWIEGIFDRASADYGKAGCNFFNYFGERLVQMACVPETARILDVATGKGAILFPLSKIIKSPGSITGVDISQQMIQEAAQELSHQGINDIVLQQMDAENLQFPDNTFDVVFCGFALFFFPSLEKALAEFKRVLKPGGILAVSTWGENKTLAGWVAGQAKTIGKQGSIVARPLWTAPALRSCLDKASFTDIQISEEDKIATHATPEAWWESIWTHGTRGYLEVLSPEQLSNLRQEAMMKVASLKSIDEPLQVIYGIAQKSL